MPVLGQERVVRLADLEPYPGTRDYLEREWYSPGDLALCNDLTYENHEAWSGRKYNDYGGYGYHVQPRSIFEVGVASGYSFAAMLFGAYGNSHADVQRLVLVDIHPDVKQAAVHLFQEFPILAISAVTVYVLDSQRDWEQIEPEEFDIVHIDGDHTYQGALNDLRHFGALVSQRGIIVVDDARDPNIRMACEQYAAVTDLETRFIENHNGHFLMQRRQP